MHFNRNAKMFNAQKVRIFSHFSDPDLAWAANNEINYSRTKFEAIIVHVSPFYAKMLRFCAGTFHFPSDLFTQKKIVVCSHL